MRFDRLAAPVVACAAVGVAGCASASVPASPIAPRTSAARSAVVAARPSAVAVRVLATRYGRILVDRNGRTLYLFTRDTSSRSRCYGACASAWPPLLVRGTPGAGPGVDRRLLGTTRRADGRTQATYRGRPLYHFVADRRPGQVLCQAAREFGGVWHVVSPAGIAIT